MQEPGDAPYGVGTHLKSSGSIGWIPERLFWVLTAGFVVGSLPAVMTYFAMKQRGQGPNAVLGDMAIAIIVWLIPVLLLLPFGMWFLEPPVEHGLMRWIAHLTRRRIVHHQDLKSLRGISILDSGFIKTPDGVRAILRLPTLNIDLDSNVAKERHRQLIGHMLDGISTHPFQFVIRSRVQTRVTAIERMKRNLSPLSRKLADWLTVHHELRQAIDRSRYMVIPAETEDVLNDRIDSILRTLRQSKLESRVVRDPEEVKAILDDWWTWRPHTDRIGPESIKLESNYIQSDGEIMSVWALHSYPERIQTNWWRGITDGDLPIDVVMTCVQQDLNWAKQKLTHRYNNLATSSPSPGRGIALRQITQLRDGLETSVKPWDIQILCVVRGATKEVHDRNARRLVQQVKDLGGKIQSLKWEMLGGMESAQPLCGPTMPYRRLELETGTITRTSIMAASTLQMLDGVPWGLSGQSVILLTTKNKKVGKHFGWYGKSGAGKSVGVRCYLARRHFADDLRVFVWDADIARHEYAGRFIDYLGGQAIKLVTLDDVQRMVINPKWKVVAFDVSEMHDNDISKAFVMVKQAVERHVLSFPGETAFVVDEAATLTDHPDPQGARALGDAVQKWRKFGIEVHVITQRVTDFLYTPIGGKIQGILAVKWYGEQEPVEISKIADKAGWTMEERERIGSAGTGEGLLIAFGQHVWTNLFEQLSPEEFDAFESDPPESIELPTEFPRNGLIAIR